MKEKKLKNERTTMVVEKIFKDKKRNSNEFLFLSTGFKPTDFFLLFSLCTFDKKHLQPNTGRKLPKKTSTKIL
jgi:hypothetical protein